MPGVDVDSVADEGPSYSPSPSISNADSEEDDQRRRAVEEDDDHAPSVTESEPSVRSHRSSVASQETGGAEHHDGNDDGIHDEQQNEDEDSNSEGSQSHEDVEPEGPPPKKHEGLLVEDKAEHNLPVGDLVITHGLCATSWYLDAVPDEGCRGSTAWLAQHAGFTGWQYLSYFYPLNTTDTTKPALFYRGGIEREALRLLNDLVAYRKDLATRYDEQSVNERPITFIAHDVGGTIVKKALTIAALNPETYLDIAYCTTCIVFLGCPHRSSAGDLEDTLIKLTYLPTDKWQPGLAENNRQLAEEIAYTNGEFYDTNMLIRASIFNIYNQGTLQYSNDGSERHIQAPFSYETVILDVPWEYNKLCDTPHNELPDGGRLDEGTTNEHFAQTIRYERTDFPTGVATCFGWDHWHKLMLAMAPPCLPAQPNQFLWQPYLIENWFVNTEPYKEWVDSTGIGVLHVVGSDLLAIKSQELYAQLQGRELMTNMVYFEFRRNDCRFNTLESMLYTLIAHMITRAPQRPDTAEAYASMMPMTAHHVALSLTDLMHIFRTLLMWRHIPPMVFMIACFDECNEDKNRFLGLIYSLREFTEMRHRFVITSLPEDGLMSRLAGNFQVDLEDFDTSGIAAWVDTFEKRYEIHLSALADWRPAFRHLMPNIREILAACGDDYRLGGLIARWIKHKSPLVRDTKAYAERIVDMLDPVSEDSVLNTIVAAFGHEEDRARLYVDWVTVAFRPLSMRELGIAVDFTENPTSEAVDFVDFQQIRLELERFGLVFHICDNTVDFWLPYFIDRAHYDEGELERAHGLIAGICLDYLSMEKVHGMIDEFCDQFLDMLSIVPFAPKDNLMSYSTQHWTLHYSKAGAHKPFEKARDFFQAKASRNAWWRMSNTLLPIRFRTSSSYLSPLPVVCSTGLEDLIEAQLAIELEAESKTLQLDLDGAFKQVALRGHVNAIPLVAKHLTLTEKLVEEAINRASGYETPETLIKILDLASSAGVKFKTPPEALCRAIWVGWTDIAKTLAESAATDGKKPEFPLQPLHLAVEHGDESLVELVIEWVDDVNARDEWNRTALHLAATVGDPAIIRTLVARGADLEATLEVNGRGVLTPLQLATASGNHLALGALLECKANLNVGASELVGVIGSFFEAPPVVYAAGMGFLKCVEVLLQHEPDLGMKVNNCSALWYAIDGDRLEISRLLLEAGADANENPQDYDMLLFLAIRSKNHEMLDLLLEHGALVDQESSWDTFRRTPLSRAAGSGDVDLVNKLLDKGADPGLVGKDSQPPLYLAAYEGHLDIAEVLLERDIDVNAGVSATGWRPLHAAYDNVSLIEKLLEKGADIDALSDSGTCLYLAAKHGQVEVVDLLIKKAAKLEIETQRLSDDLPAEELGMTALCVACLKGQTAVIRSLLKAGANVDKVCKDEKTGEDETFPLMIAMNSDAYGAVEIIETLLEFRPNVKLAANGTTVLHCITPATPLGVVKALVAAGAEVEVLNKAKVSPLLIAMDSRNTDVALYLISRGANVNHFTTEFASGGPLHIACKYSDYALFQALIEKGADVSRADESGYHSTLLAILAGTGDGWYMTEPIAKYLLETAGVDPNAKSRKQPWFALSRSVWEPTEEMTTYLLDKGADPNVEDAWGLRPVHFAAWYSWENYKLILDSGVKDPFPLNKLNMSPLHYSVGGRIWNDEWDTVMETAGATVRDKDLDGWDAVMWSAKGNFNDPATIEAVLKRAGDDALWIKGYGNNDRLWSPLKAAKFYGATDAVYNALTPPEDKRMRLLESGEEEHWQESFHESREGDFKDMPCAMCLNKIYGPAHRCPSCDVSVCYKCIRSKEIFDPGHDYEEIGPEFVAEEESAAPDGEVIDSDGAKSPYTVAPDDALVSRYGSDGSSDGGSADDEASSESSYEVEVDAQRDDE